MLVKPPPVVLGTRVNPIENYMKTLTRFGRLNLFSLTCLTIAISGCLVTVMPTIAAFTTMRFIEGTGVGGCIVTAYVLIIEYCSSKHRETVTALFHIPITLGHMILPGISYLLRDMDDFQLAISIPMFLFVPVKWLIMESPLWLLDRDRIDQLVEGLNVIHPNSVQDIRKEIESYRESRRARSTEKVKFWQIFNHKRLSINFACMSVNYFVCGMGYYGVSQFIGAMAGDIHQNVTISGLLLLPAAVSSVFLLKIFSRRYFLMTSNIMSGIFMLAAIGTPHSINWLRVVFACIANCFFFVIFILVFLFSVELFPTSIRNSVLGVLSMLSRIGQVITPPINALESETAAGAIFGCMAILGAIACVPLPETKHINLPSSVIDIKLIKDDQSAAPHVELSDTRGTRSS